MRGRKSSLLRFWPPWLDISWYYLQCCHNMRFHYNEAQCKLKHVFQSSYEIVLHLYWNWIRKIIVRMDNIIFSRHPLRQKRDTSIVHSEVGVGTAQLVQWQATGWQARVRFPAGARFCLLRGIQTSSGAPPPSQPPMQQVLGTLSLGRGGGKAVRAWSWLLISSYCRDQKWWSYTSTPACVFMG
jgi:hypothetical protein